MQHQPDYRDTEALIFVDESGNESLDVDKQGVTPLFVAAALIVQSSDVEAVRAGVLAIEQELCGGNQTKSSQIGSRHQRRLQFIERAVKLPFEFVVVAVDKRKLQRGTGLEYKRSFRKSMCSYLYDVLQGFTRSCIVADRHGTEEFQREFRAYMNAEFPRTLFHLAPEISFESSAEEPGIRLVDWIAGTYNAALATGYKDPHLWQCRELLRPKEIRATIWPVLVREMPTTRATTQDCDPALRELMLSRAVDYVNKYQDAGEELMRVRAALLGLLLSHQAFERAGERNYYLTSGLQHALKAQGFKPLSDQAFRRTVLGPIRDAGIVLAGGAKGMRIATCASDVFDYRDHVKHVVLPMIGRLKRCREDLRAQQDVRLDMLKGDDVAVLRKLVDAAGDAALFVPDEEDESE